MRFVEVLTVAPSRFGPVTAPARGTIVLPARAAEPGSLVRPKGSCTAPARASVTVHSATCCAAPRRLAGQLSSTQRSSLGSTRADAGTLSDVSAPLGAVPV